MKGEVRVVAIGCNHVNTKAFKIAAALAGVHVQSTSVGFVDSISARQLELASELAVYELAAFAHESIPSRCFIDDHLGAQAPGLYINQNIQTIAPHKKRRRSKFKRR